MLGVSSPAPGDWELTTHGWIFMIDFHPDAPTGRPRHTLPRRTVIEVFTAGAFTLVEDHERWFGNTYCVMFRRDDD